MEVGAVRENSKYQRFAHLDSTRCPITRSMRLLGDRWSLLIVRDVAMGIQRFTDLQTHLGVSKGILSTKLDRLVQAGVLQRGSYQEPGARSREDYQLSQAGEHLVPVLLALVKWGNAHAPPANYSAASD
ncbi:helix-turn-helix transcriptional regulator [Mycobacteroides abscessus subsp. bolletii]|uniref:winged helix-turn-helix transcriptional regulator n=1 Tax=Mycobacteroides abscessus TaxID=36809 RepID=UPI0019D18D83|nr:helix-turn-helix domain-containing protein [Mycobacteroides abscessus]MBN7300495.1 helix-turn-helix transcriptional regulator [Mycobacteroides abscessus subsp. bolletii]